MSSAVKLCCSETDKIPREDQPKNPNFSIAQLRFSLSLPENANDEGSKTRLFDYITADDMAPYYEEVCRELNWTISQTALNLMREQNTLALQRFDDEIEDASENLGATEIKQAYLKRADYLSKIGDKYGAIESLNKAYEYTKSLGYKLDNVFHCLRIGLFFMDQKLVEQYLQIAEVLIEDETANWHSRNCYNILKALHCLAIRSFNDATELLVAAIPTFTCTELISFDEFVKYTVIVSVLTLTRSETKSRIIDNGEVQKVLYSNEDLRQYLLSLYDCDYSLFFRKLAAIELLIKSDMFLSPHYRYYVREMRTKSYNQILVSYSSLKITYMADRFGVTPEYIEDEISRLIACGKLNYKIDKASESIVNTPRDKKAEMFSSVVHHGDALLNRIQKLSRIVEV